MDEAPTSLQVKRWPLDTPQLAQLELHDVLAW
jgi:hypothetical protein